MASPPSVSCGYASVGAASAVQSHLLTVTGYANSALSETFNTVSALRSTDVTFTPLRVHLDDVSMMTPVPPPPDPSLQDVTMGTFERPEMGSVTLPLDIQLSTAPTRPSDPPLPTTLPAPDRVTPDIPDPVTYTDPGDAPEYTAVENPVELPTMYPITLPPDPTLGTVTFVGVRPGTLPSVPDAAFEFTEDAYVSELLPTIQAKLLEIFNDGTGLPAAAAEAMRNRLYADVEASSAKAEAEAFNQYGARGFYMPPGMLTARLKEVQKANRDARGAANRDVYLKEVDVQIDMLKTALSQGIALEDILIRLHISVQERKLTAARALVDVAIALFNVRVERLNAEIALYNADLGVYRGQIEAQLAQIQIYAEQIRAQSLLGEMNQTMVQMYAEGFRAVESNARAYSAEVEGYQAKIDAIRARIDAWRAEIEGQVARVEAYRTEVQAYAERVRAEGLHQDNYRIRAETYGAAVQGWSAESQAKIEKYKAELEEVDSVVRKFVAEVEAYRADLTAEEVRLTTIGRTNDRTLQAHQITTQAVISQNEAAARKSVTELEKAKANAAIEVQVGQTNIQNGMNAASLLLRANETAAQVYGNLTSSAINAISVNASIQDSASTSQGCTQSVNYQTSF